jgi:hypothetical protein
MPLPIISIRRMSLRKTLVIGILAMTVVAITSEAVEVTSSTEFVTPGVTAAAWSPDGTRVMLAEFHKSEQRMHLCVYGAATKKKEKCIYFLNPEPDTTIWAIDWTDEYIHLSYGVHLGAVIYRLPVPDWEKPGFKELQIDKAKAMREEQAYDNPAWDKWKQGLFFTGEDERYGIQFLPKRGKPEKYVSGVDPAVTRNYLWYTSITEDGDLRMDGIRRIEKATGKKERLTIGPNDVSVTPRQDEKAALFIREAALYAYVEGKGVIGPLMSGDKKSDEELKSIHLSPNGEQALLRSVSEHPTDKFKSVVTLKLLSVRW